MQKRSSCRIGRAFVSSLPCTYKLAKSLATPIPNQRADDYGDGMNMHTTSALFSCDARLRDARQQSTFPPVSQILQSCGKGRSSSCRSVRDLADTTKPGRGGEDIKSTPPLPGRGIIWLALCRSRHWTNRSIEFFPSLPSSSTGTRRIGLSNLCFCL